jgi:hypothetical protein
MLRLVALVRTDMSEALTRATRRNIPEDAILYYVAFTKWFCLVCTQMVTVFLGLYAPLNFKGLSLSLVCWLLHGICNEVWRISESCRLDHKCCNVMTLQVSIQCHPVIRSCLIWTEAINKIIKYIRSQSSVIFFPLERQQLLYSKYTAIIMKELSFKSTGDLKPMSNVGN